MDMNVLLILFCSVLLFVHSQGPPNFPETKMLKCYSKKGGPDQSVIDCPPDPFGIMKCFTQICSRFGTEEVWKGCTNKDFGNSCPFNGCPQGIELKETSCEKCADNLCNQQGGPDVKGPPNPKPPAPIPPPGPPVPPPGPPAPPQAQARRCYKMEANEKQTEVTCPANYQCFTQMCTDAWDNYEEVHKGCSEKIFPGKCDNWQSSFCEKYDDYGKQVSCEVCDDGDLCNARGTAVAMLQMELWAWILLLLTCCCCCCCTLLGIDNFAG